MEHQLLQRFNNDKAMKEAVLAYCVEFFEARIVEKAYKGENVTDMALASKALEDAFEQINDDFAVEVNKKFNETNRAS